MKIFFIAILILLSACNTAAKKSSHIDNRTTVKDNQVLIKRDDYGVPHIYANSVYNLFYGYGYAAAEDRLFSLEMAKRSGQGKVAEVLGRGDKDKYIRFDQKVRSHYKPESIKQQLANLVQEDRDIFEGYAQGVNAYIQKIKGNPDKLKPKQFLDFGFQPEQWTAYDVAMIFIGSMVNRFGDFNTEITNASILSSLQKQHGQARGKAIFNQLNPQVIEGSATTISNREWQASRVNLPGKDQQQLAHNSVTSACCSNLSNYAADGSAFSNIIILGRDKSKNADSILVNGPQFGWYAPAYTYSVGLHGAGFNIVGNTPYAYPVILFGHNEDIAWGSTWGAGDLIDIYVEKLDQSNSEKYLFNGSYRSMEKRKEIIKVKNSESIEFWAYRTVHGPVVKWDKKNSIAYAKKRTWEGRELDSLLGWLHSTKARNFKGWLKETERSALNINMYYADKKGNIGYVFTGKYPIRNKDHDNRLPVSGQGENEWEGLHNFSYNPKVYNPEQGYITNWNNRPAYGVLNPDMFWYSWSKADRVSFLVDEVNKKQKMTEEEAWSLIEKSSLADLNARYFVPLITKAVKAAKDTKLKEMAGLLQKWDFYSRDKNSDGKYDEAATAIFQTFLPLMIKETLQDDLGDVFKFYANSGYQKGNSSSGSTNIQIGVKAIVESILSPEQQSYDFFNSRSPEVVALSAFVKTKESLEENFGMNIKQWKLPISKIRHSSNNFLGMPQANVSEEITPSLYLNRGSENNLVVFSSDEVTSYEVVSPGQSAFINPKGEKHKHYDDQVNIFQNFGKKRIWLNDKDVEVNKRSQTVLTVTH